MAPHIAHNVLLTKGPLLCSVLLMFTNMRKRVTMRAILPGTISTGIRNEMKDMTVSMRVGRRVFMK